jgi:hypothetical protein
MMSLSLRSTVFALAIASAVPLLSACPKKEPAPADAAPPPPPPEPDASTVLVPMEEPPVVEDAGVDASPPKYTGPAVNPNVARFKQCCNALAAEAKRMGNSPEAGMFASAAAQCNTIANQLGPKGTAPELGVVRTLLAGRTLPAACSGF